MKSRNDVEEFRPILRTIGAFLLYASGRVANSGDAYRIADEFVNQLAVDIDEELTH